MSVAVGFRFRFSELLPLFPEVKTLHVFEDERYSSWENARDKGQYIQNHKNYLEIKMKNLGYDSQDTSGFPWIFTNSKMNQTLKYYLAIHKSIRKIITGEDAENKAVIYEEIKNAEILFNDMIVSERYLKLFPKLNRVVVGGDCWLEPDEDDLEFKNPPLKNFLWNNPEYIQNFTAWIYPHNFPYGKPDRISLEYMRKNVKMTNHSSLKSVFEYYKDRREEILDSESEAE